RDLLGKRTMDFKVTYLDAGLTSAYFSDSEISNGTPSANGALANHHQTPPTTTTKIAKRYKTHLREFLSSCRGKRKNSQSSGANHSNTNGPPLGSEGVYTGDPYAYSPGSGATPSHPPHQLNHGHYADYVQTPPAAAAAAYPSLYSAYLASYRSLTTYYPEYANAASYIAGNSYLADPSARNSLASLQYDQFNRYFDDKETKYSFPGTPQEAPENSEPRDNNKPPRKSPRNSSKNSIPYDYSKDPSNS
ncbi:Uncharacterized protein FKW44_011961, partial [Caligus rogercresseyi]